MFKKTIVTLMMILIATSLHAFEGKDRIVWKKKPLVINLKVGEERIIYFPAPVKHWMPSVVANNVIASVVGDVFYIKASSEFSRVRFRIRESASQQMYLLDVSASIDADVPNELIVIDAQKLRGESIREGEKIEKTTEDWRVRLTRFASQQFYAPKRLAIADSSIHRIPMAKTEVPLFRGGKVKATPLGSWKGGGWYVHAVKLENTSDTKITIDQRNAFRGRWSTATPQHPTILPKGTSGDVTTVYLTSSQPFPESMGIKEASNGG